MSTLTVSKGTEIAGTEDTEELEKITTLWIRAQAKKQPYLLSYDLIGIIAIYCIYKCIFNIFDTKYISKISDSKMDRFTILLPLVLPHTSLINSVAINDGHSAKIKLLNNLTGTNHIRFGFRDSFEYDSYNDYCFSLKCTRGIGYIERIYKDKSSNKIHNEIAASSYDWAIVPKDIIKMEKKKNWFIWSINNDAVAAESLENMKNTKLYFWLAFGGYTCGDDEVRIQVY